MISFDDSGEAVKTQELEGAQFYNLLNYKNTATTDNGFSSYAFSNNKTSVSKYKDFKGYLEPNNAFIHKNILFKIYNYGSNDDGEYITHLESSNGFKKDVVGYLENYSVDDSNIYLYLSDLNISSSSRYINVISLNTLETTSTVLTPTQEGDKVLPIFGVSEGRLVFLEEVLNTDGSKAISMISVSGANGEVSRTSIISDLDGSSGILLNASFLEGENLIIVTDKLEVIQFDLMENFVVNRNKVSDDLQNKYATVKKNNEILYMLYPGENLVLYSFDLKKSLLVDKILIQDAPKNMSVFDFLISK